MSAECTRGHLSVADGTAAGTRYRATQRALAWLGLAVLAATTVVLVVRGVETTEVLAVVLFLPIFVAVLVDRVRGGVLAAVVATVVYGLVRANDVGTLSNTQVAELITTRGVAYLVFGGLAGWAVGMLEDALVKLDTHDVVDDDTLLLNARAMVRELDLEIARATRYRSTFAVVVAEVPSERFGHLRASRRRTLLRSLGAAVTEAVRTVDRPGAARDDDALLVLAVLPETEAQGAQLVAERLGREVTATLAAATTPEGTKGPPVLATPLCHPRDADALGALRTRLADINRRVHPEAPDLVAEPIYRDAVEHDEHLDLTEAHEPAAPGGGGTAGTPGQAAAGASEG